MNQNKLEKAVKQAIIKLDLASNLNEVNLNFIVQSETHEFTLNYTKTKR